jgi:hypothetical protein
VASSFLVSMTIRRVERCSEAMTLSRPLRWGCVTSLLINALIRKRFQFRCAEFKRDHSQIQAAHFPLACSVIARAIAAHRGGRASEVDGKAVLDHLLSAGLVSVEPVKVPRPKKGADTRQGLVLTPSGKASIQRLDDEVTPQSPQPTATSLQDDACGEPPGSPATPGGYGGVAAGSDALRSDIGNADRSADESSFAINGLSQNGRDASSRDGEQSDRGEGDTS